jgi:hypothetical protein
LIKNFSEGVKGIQRKRRAGFLPRRDLKPGALLHTWLSRSAKTPRPDQRWVEREFSREVSAYSTDLQGLASEAGQQSLRLLTGHPWKIGLDQIP